MQTTFMNTYVEKFDSGTEILENKNHVFAPKWMANSSVTWKPISKFQININARYLDESFMELSNDKSYTIPSSFVLNSRASWNIRDAISVSLWVNNILDKQYFTDGAPVDLDYDGISEGPGYRIQAPRSVFLNFSLKF